MKTTLMPIGHSEGAACKTRPQHSLMAVARKRAAEQRAFGRRQSRTDDRLSRMGLLSLEKITVRCYHWSGFIHGLVVQASSPMFERRTGLRPVHKPVT